MHPIRIFILWLQWKLFGRRSVVLIDYDGEANSRLVHGYRRWLVAKRYGGNIENIRLLPNGATSGACYVKRWEPLFPPDFALEELKPVTSE